MYLSLCDQNLLANIKAQNVCLAVCVCVLAHNLELREPIQTLCVHRKQKVASEPLLYSMGEEAEELEPTFLDEGRKTYGGFPQPHYY